MKYKYIARQLGISNVSMSNKVHGKSDFRLGEVRKMRELLGLSDRELIGIFFTRDVD